MKQVTHLLQPFFLTCCLLLACGQMAQASVKYVKQTASGTGDGSSWTNASDDLQAMIDAAASGDEVWVAAGIYKPTSGADRSIFFVMKEGVAILGGFPASGTPGIFNRNWTANVTTLSGDIGILGDNSDNSYNVIRNTNNGLTTSAILDGFTVSGGNADSPSYNNGGGMFNFSASPKVVNCLFENNASASFGGGMHNIISSPDVINCTFNGNSAGSSGGGMNNISSSPTLTNCLFINNSAEISGGGMNQSGSSTLTSCSFIGNYSGNTGGGMFISGSPTLTNCVFRGNSTVSTGGGIFNSGSPTLTNCSFSGNDAAAAGLGGVAGSSLIITNCIIWGNSSGITGSANVTYSIVQGGHPGTGNLNVNPLFVSNSDLSLQSGSPAIDAGDDNANNTPLDLAGNNRKFDAIPGGTLIDMGAYESQSVVCQLNPVCANPTVQLDATGNVTVYAADLNGGSTGCGTLDFSIGISGLPSTTFDCSGIGTNLVTLTVTDDNGSATCQSTLTVEDNLPPNAQCKNINKALGNGPGGNVTLLPSEVNNFSTDNCGGTGGVTLVSVSPNSFSCSSSPVQTVTLTVKDAQNLTNTCSATVNIVDLTDPVAVCQSATIQLNGSGNASLTPAEVDGGSSDNCGITLMSVFPNTFTCANVGANNVTLTVEDAFGGKHSCLALVDVQDTTSPTVICPADITADVDAGICCATLSIDAPTVSDNCTTLNFSNDRNGPMTPAEFISQGKPSSIGQLLTAWAIPSPAYKA
ncbi:MAG: choice-of-anchor Q domain-containing protein [Saprospiraceae bacterium]